MTPLCTGWCQITGQNRCVGQPPPWFCPCPCTVLLTQPHGVAVGMYLQENSPVIWLYKNSTWWLICVHGNDQQECIGDYIWLKGMYYGGRRFFEPAKITFLWLFLQLWNTISQCIWIAGNPRNQNHQILNCTRSTILSFFLEFCLTKLTSYLKRRQKHHTLLVYLFPGWHLEEQAGPRHCLTSQQPTYLQWIPPPHHCRVTCASVIFFTLFWCSLI